MRSFIALLVALFLAIAQADVYLHSPRGANDRCDEKSNNRNNDQRLFDSENNAAGGYGVADQELAFYEDTVMRIEWYSQHNCGNGAQVKDDPGNPEGVNCNHVLQLGCENNFAAYSESMPAAQIAKNIPYALTDGVSLGRPGADAGNTLNNGNQEDVFNTFGDTCTQRRTTTADCANGNGNQGNCATLNLADGGNRNTFNGGDCQCSARKTLTYALHEPEAYWLKAKLRERNKGLFTADQNVNNNNGALRTRQEPNSARYGFEVVEERDYWPYWHPSPWMDLAVMTSDLKQCTFFRSESQNQKNKCECLDPADATNTAAMKFNQAATCTAAGFQFVCSGAFDWTLPDCLLAPSQPDNSLARTDIKGDNSQQTDGARLAHYDWAIPTGKSSIIPAGQTETRCTIRLRYNISNAEVAADFDVQDNGKLKGNPVQTFGLGNVAAKVNETIPLRMAVNTAQFGRVFQDRTYVFTVKQRPAELQGKTIHNVNVRGKRGNIAQVRNCFEYDFNPLILNAEVGDIVHFQWALTDYNDNNNAGEGRAGTDRVNVVPVSQYTKNLPQVLNLTDTIFASDDLKTLAWLRQDPALCFNTQDMLGNQKNNQNDPKSCHFLNGVRAAPQPLSPKPNNQVRNGLLPTSSFNYMSKIVKNGSFQYMSSRNNNFSNRSQKAVINVGKKAIGSGGGSGTNGMGVGDGATNTPLGGGSIGNLSVGALAGIVVGSVAGAAVIGGLAFVAIKKGGLSFSSRV